MKRFYCVLAVLFLALPLSGCGTPQAEVIEVTPQTADQDSSYEDEMAAGDKADAATGDK